MDYKSNRKKGCRSNDTGGINMEKLIQIKNLTKCFGETKVLDKINVNFDRGHIYGIIGRNGSGKSMLMKCICGLVVPTSGEIIIDNKKLGLVIAVDLSYLDVRVQKWVYEYFKENGFLKPVQVEALKNHSNLSNASQHMIITILNEALPKKSTAAKVSLSEKKLDKYFPPHYSAKDRENVIIQLLEQWSTQQAQE